MCIQAKFTRARVANETPVTGVVEVDFTSLGRTRKHDRFDEWVGLRIRPATQKPLTDVQLMDGRTARVGVENGRPGGGKGRAKQSARHQRLDDVVSVMDRQSVELIPSHPIYDPLIQQIYDRLPDAIKSNQIKSNQIPCDSRQGLHNSR